MKKKSILRKILPWVIAAALLAALVIFVGIPLYSQKDEQTTPLPHVTYFEGKAETITLENDALSRMDLHSRQCGQRPRRQEQPGQPVRFAVHPAHDLHRPGQGHR